MSRIFVHGCGAVSPAGWGIGPLREALASGIPIPAQPLPRPGWEKPLLARQVPPPRAPLSFLANPRLRRTSPITQYLTAAALEALGPVQSQAPAHRLGVVFCTLSGCVNYSRRFYDEALRNPATASPVVFPETVFNAPASHLAALLGITTMNYTLVGDTGVFLHGLALAAQWLLTNQVDGCLVVGAEECDWLIGDALRLFNGEVISGAGAGALFLKREREGALAELTAITQTHPFNDFASRKSAARLVREDLPPGADSHLLVDGRQAVPRLDAPETIAWQEWSGPRLSPKMILGESLMAASAWQCVAGIDALRSNVCYTGATISIVGCNQEAIGAHFAGV